MTASSSVTNDLRLACDDLNRRGYSATLTAVSYCGDLDMRLVVRRAHPHVCVELLAPDEEDSHDSWYAVRIASGRRTVWRGPSRTEVVSGLDLVGFVIDLTTLPDLGLRRRYRTCEPRSQRRAPLAAGV